MEAEILEQLKQKKTISGTELGKALGISRTAVWKYINELRQAGYVIKSSPRKGYTFVSAPDLLLPDEIKAGLKTRMMG